MFYKQHTPCHQKILKRYDVLFKEKVFLFWNGLYEYATIIQKTHGSLKMTPFVVMYVLFIICKREDIIPFEPMLFMYGKIRLQF